MCEHMNLRRNFWTGWVAALALAGCGGEAQLQVESGTGPDPRLPPPEESLIPTVNIAPAVGWPDGGNPVAADGLKVVAFADKLDHPRWLHVLPNGDVLVAETNAPERPNGRSCGLRGWVMRQVDEARRRRRAERQSNHAAARCRRRRCSRSAHGVFSRISIHRSAWSSSATHFYVANTDALLRFPYRRGSDDHGRGEQVAELPGGRSTTTGPRTSSRAPTDRSSTSRWAPTATSPSTAWTRKSSAPRSCEIDPATGARRVFASGLRNPERPGVGAGDGHAVDGGERARRARQRSRPRLPDLRARRRVLRLALQLLRPASSTIASSRRGRTWSRRRDHARLRARTAHGLAWPRLLRRRLACPNLSATAMFIGQHGSWNRKPLSGYRVIFVPFSGGRPAGGPRRRADRVRR